MRHLVVTDTSCLIALDRIGHLDILPKLYDVVAPEAVAREFGTVPAWLRVERVEDRQTVDRLRAVLDLGEAEAITWATGVRECSVLLDEARGRRVAASMGLDVVGTLGVLVRAKRWGMIGELQPLIDRLVREHGFRASAQIVQDALRQADEMT